MKDDRFFPWEGPERTDLKRVYPDPGEVLAATIHAAAYCKNWYSTPEAHLQKIRMQRLRRRYGVDKAAL